MSKPRLGRPECETVLSELEELSVHGVGAGEVSSALSEASRRHLIACEQCRSVLEDFTATREALAPMKEMLPEAGPWFAARVMAAVKSAEIEIEDRKEGVWISVRRLAPRLAAFAALLLVLGGTWAMELRYREVNSGQTQMRSAEGLFEAGPNAPVNDDIVSSANEETRP